MLFCVVMKGRSEEFKAEAVALRLSPIEHETRSSRLAAAASGGFPRSGWNPLSRPDAFTA
jgi:hypothetical protein